LLARIAASEKLIYATIGVSEKHFVMLGYVARQRAQLERSFRTAIADMQQSQKERPTRPQPQPAQPAKPVPEPPSPKPDVPPPSYVMSEGTQDHTVFCAPPTLDTR
jgi:hypothetical protein